MIRPGFAAAKLSATRNATVTHAARWRWMSVVRAFIVVSALAIVAVSPALAATFLERAQQYFDDGNLQAAEVELKNALQRDPNDPEARVLLGKVHLKRGDAPSAEKEFLRAHELGYTNEELDLLLAYARLDQQQFDTVLKTITEASAAASDLQRDLFVARGEALLGLGQFEEAEAIFDRVLQDGPHVQALVNKARIALALNDGRSARELLDQAAAVDPDDPRLLAVYGAWHYQEKHFAQARDSFARARQRDPTRLENHIGYIQALLGLGELEEAATVVEALKAANSDIPAIMLQDAIVQFLRGRFQQAEIAADRILGIAPRLPQALLVAGHSAFQLKKFEKARVQLGAYLAQNPHDHQARMTLGLTMLSLGYPQEAYGTLRAPEGGEIPDHTAYLDVLTTAAFAVGDRIAGLKYLEQLAERQPGEPAVQERLGLARQSQGNPEGGAEAFERAIALQPDRHSAYMQLFTARLQQRRPDLAVEVAQRTKEQFPDQTSGDTMLGIAYLTTRDLEKARQAFERAATQEPDNPATAGNLANVLRLQGNIEEARAVLDRVLEAEPGHLETLLVAADLASAAGDHIRAEALWQQAIDHNRTAVQPRVLLGNHYITIDRPGEALAVAEPLLGANPNHLGLLETVGQARLRTGDRTGALKVFETLAKLVPGSAPAQEYLMWALEENRRPAEALEAAERTLALDPANARARFGEVRYLAQLGRLDEAKAKLATLRENFPEKVDLLLLEARIALAEKRADDALASYRKAFDLRRNNFVLIELVRAHFAARQVDEGLAAMRDWLAEYPDDLLTRNSLAEAYMGLGHLPEAEQQYQAALELAPDNPWLLNNLAWLRMLLGQSEEALQPARKALGLAPGEPEIADTLAVVLLEVGEKKEALALLQKARQDAADNPTIHFHFARALAANGEMKGAVAELRALLQQETTFSERQEAEALLAELSGQ